MKAILIVFVLINLSCKSNKPMTNKTEEKLTTRLEMSKSTFQIGDSIVVKFWVQNKTNADFEFCPWQTPLEKEFLAPFFEIKYNNQKVPYIGKQVKRKPPTKNDNLVVEPKQTISQEINIKEGYHLDKPGVYTIRFLGRTINGLPDSKPIRFSIK